MFHNRHVNENDLDSFEWVESCIDYQTYMQCSSELVFPGNKMEIKGVNNTNADDFLQCFSWMNTFYIIGTPQQPIETLFQK
jgi:hypothetical protein